jgi:hypothetical protein
MATVVSREPSRISVRKENQETRVESIAQGAFVFLARTSRSGNRIALFLPTANTYSTILGAKLEVQLMGNAHDESEVLIMRILNCNLVV